MENWKFHYFTCPSLIEESGGVIRLSPLGTSNICNMRRSEKPSPNFTQIRLKLLEKLWIILIRFSIADISVNRCIGGFWWGPLICSAYEVLLSYRDTSERPRGLIWLLRILIWLLMYLDQIIVLFSCFADVSEVGGRVSQTIAADISYTRVRCRNVQWNTNQ